MFKALLRFYLASSGCEYNFLIESGATSVLQFTLVLKLKPFERSVLARVFFFLQGLIEYVRLFFAFFIAHQVATIITVAVY
jgi:hypothetical protein